MFETYPWFADVVAALLGLFGTAIAAGVTALVGILAKKAHLSLSAEQDAKLEKMVADLVLRVEEEIRRHRSMPSTPEAPPLMSKDAIFDALAADVGLDVAIARGVRDHVLPRLRSLGAA